MKLVRKTCIEFLYPGVYKSPPRRVKTRDVSKVKVPKSAYGFKFFDILSVVVDADDKKVELMSEPFNVSPRHYYGGKIYTVAELKREFPDEHILISNIAGGRYKKAIHCRIGRWQPLEKTDIFIEEMKS